MGTPPRDEGLPLIGEYMSRESTMMIEQYVNATTKEIDDIKWKLMDSIHFNFNERECNILYRLAAFDLLTSSDCKSAIMLMAQKLGNIAIPKEEDE